MPKRKSEKQIEVYGKFKKPEFKEMTRPIENVLSSNKITIPSRVGCNINVFRTSIMDPINLQRESVDVQAAIIEKSRRIAPAFNKGALQYITEGSDPAHLGRKL